MIAVVQRVAQAEVLVHDSASATTETPAHRAAIGRGLCVLLAVEPSDSESDAAWMARKLAALRIFPDEDGRMNRSVRDIAGAILLISQFTLAGDCAKGNRPSFVGAADPAIAQPLYERCAELLRTVEGIPTGTGIFAAHMNVTLTNDGPVTLIIRTPA